MNEEKIIAPLVRENFGVYRDVLKELLLAVHSFDGTRYSTKNQKDLTISESIFIDSYEKENYVSLEPISDYLIGKKIKSIQGINIFDVLRRKDDGLFTFLKVVPRSKYKSDKQIQWEIGPKEKTTIRKVDTGYMYGVKVSKLLTLDSTFFTSDSSALRDYEKINNYLLKIYAPLFSMAVMFSFVGKFVNDLPLYKIKTFFPALDWSSFGLKYNDSFYPGVLATGRILSEYNKQAYDGLLHIAYSVKRSRYWHLYVLMESFEKLLNEPVIVGYLSGFLLREFLAVVDGLVFDFNKKDAYSPVLRVSRFPIGGDTAKFSVSPDSLCSSIKLGLNIMYGIDATASSYKCGTIYREQKVPTLVVSGKKKNELVHVFWYGIYLDLVPSISGNSWFLLTPRVDVAFHGVKISLRLTPIEVMGGSGGLI